MNITNVKRCMSLKLTFFGGEGRGWLPLAVFATLAGTSRVGDTGRQCTREAQKRNSYSIMRRCRSEFSWYTHQTSRSQLIYFKVPGDLNQDSIPIRGPWNPTRRTPAWWTPLEKSSYGEINWKRLWALEGSSYDCRRMWPLRRTVYPNASSMNSSPCGSQN